MQIMCQAAGFADSGAGAHIDICSALLTGDVDASRRVIDGQLQQNINHAEVSHTLESIICSSLNVSIKISLLKYLLTSPALSISDRLHLLKKSCILHIAINSGYSELVRVMLDFGCNAKDSCVTHQVSPLHEAARVGDEVIIDLLLEAGASADAYDHCHPRRTPLIVAVQNHKKKPVFWKLLTAQRNNNTSPLRGDCGKQNMVLLVASREGNHEALEVLLQRGRLDVNWQSVDGDSALMIAALHGQLPAVQYLLSRPGCDTDLQNSEGQTVLHMASPDAVVKALIKSGADADITDNLHQTALLCKVDEGQTCAVKHLLQANCRTDMVNHNGVSAVQLAVTRGHSEITIMLALSGAVLSHNAMQGEQKDAERSRSLQLHCLNLYKYYYKRSLKDCVRVLLRSQLNGERRSRVQEQPFLHSLSSSGPKFQRKLESLKLPNALRNYLQMSDLDHLHVPCDDLKAAPYAD